MNVPRIREQISREDENGIREHVAIGLGAKTRANRSVSGTAETILSIVNLGVLKFMSIVVARDERERRQGVNERGGPPFIPRMDRRTRDYLLHLLRHRDKSVTNLGNGTWPTASCR